MSSDIDTSWVDGSTGGEGNTSSGRIPDEDLDAAREDVIEWAENLVKINGRPLDYQNKYRYWQEPLRAVMAEDTERIHIWKMARGMGKTVQSSIPELRLPTTRKMVDVIHTVPRSDQLNSYMKRTVARMIETSRGDPPILEEMLADSSVAVKRNKFRTGSFLEGRSAWGDGRSIQGFHGAFGTADEFQNWTAEAAANLKEAIDSGMGRILLTGTPDYEGTIYHEHWQESTQHRWHYECPTCSTDQTITLDSVDVIDTDPKRWGLFCRQCGTRFEKTDILLGGFWRATNDAGVHRGYTISQLISPRHPLDEVMRTRELASTSKAEFYRFKLARFYSGGAKPIPEAAIYACCNDQIGLQIRAERGFGPYYIGVDWGGGESSDTIVVVCTVDERDTDHWPTSITIRNVERIEYEHRGEELRKVADIVNRFNIGSSGRGMFDLGYGEAHVDALQNGDKRENAIPERGWGSNITGHRFDLSPSNDPGGKWPFLKRDGKTVHAAQAPWANRVFDLFPEVQGYDDPDAGMDYDTERTPTKRIEIPYQDRVETRDVLNYWFGHLTAVKREYYETKQGKRQERITTFQSTQKDDGFYALTYAYTAACLGGKRGGYEPMNIGGGTA